MKSIDLETLSWYTKQQLAIHQLDRSIQLLLDDNDAISATTLAGAAEELLGKLVERAGKQPSLKGFIDGCVEAGRLIHGETWHPKTFAEMANFTRNELKHLGDNEKINVSAGDACDLIDRAVENLSLLEEVDSAHVRRYIHWRRSL